MKKIRFFSLIIGLGLLGLNISGLFLSLRSDAIYSETDNVFINDVSFDYQKFAESIERIESESDENYVQRLNEVVNQGTAHYWFDEGINKYHLTIPPWENYILYGMSFVWPNYYEKYEYKNYKKAMERGVGICSQHAIIETGILNQNGVEAEIIGLSGHVVLRANVNGDWMVLDPDYGVVIPYDLYEIEGNPSLVYEYYENIESTYHDPKNALSAEDMVQIYGAEGNAVHENGIIGYAHWVHFYFEQISYIVIWLIPILLLLPYGWRFIKRKR